MNTTPLKYFIEDTKTGKWLKMPQSLDDCLIDTSRNSVDAENRKWTNDPLLAMGFDTFDEAELHNKKYLNMVDIEVTEHEFVNFTTPPDKKLTPMAEAIEWIMQQDELLMNKTRMIIVAKLDTLLKKELEILPVSTCLSKIDGWSFDYDFLKEISKYANEIEDGISMEEVDAVLTAIKNYFTQNYRQQ